MNTVATHLSSASHVSWKGGVAYGLIGFPLAFAALPLYVLLPDHYARQFGLPLATIGVLFMAVRLLDAIVDPLIGRLSDALYARSVQAVLWVAGLSALAQILGMAGLFFPPVRDTAALAAWMVTGLLLTCLAHSQLAIAHQAWGVQLGGSVEQRSHIVAWREGHGLLGVVVASSLPVIWGIAAIPTVLALALLLGWAALWFAPRPLASSARITTKASLHQPLRVPAFQRLLSVYLCNGIAGAIPAALMLFFAQDKLGATQADVALFLVLYFVAGALSMPMWLRLVRWRGLERAWLAGMLLAIACFGWTAMLSEGQVLLFAIICALTGVALGADLTVPGALLAITIEGAGAQGRQDGAYLGWWNLATKLNLGLAAGSGFPLLQWVGYVPGTRNEEALQHLAWTYALLPCALKLLAAVLLYRLFIRPRQSPGVAAFTPGEPP